MTQARLRTLGLAFVASLGLMALAASAAQAANEFLLLHPGKLFAEEGVASETFEGALEERFRIIIPEENQEGIEIWCPVGAMSGTVYPTLLHANISLAGCAEYEVKELMQHYWELKDGKDTEPLECTLNSLNMLFMKVKAVPVLHEKMTYLLWVPLEAGAPFETLKFSGAFCPLPPEQDLTGSVVSTIIQLNVVAQLFGFDGQLTLLFQGKGLPGDKLMYNGQEVYFQTAFDELKLTGAKAGEAWGAH